MTTRIAAFVLLAACTDTSTAPRTYSFGPFDLAPTKELTDLCVSVTLHNDAPIFVNSVEMTGAPGIHHSNWFFIPEGLAITGPDGAWSCSAGNPGGGPFDQAAATLSGGVLFAQSTQATHEVQAFAAGAAIKIPPHSKIVASVHLLNATDRALTIPLSLTIDPIPEPAVTSVLAGFSMQNLAIALPPHATSRFAVECDLSERWNQLHALGNVASDHIDFKIYHALSHYHALGTALAFEAIRDSDGGSDLIWSTDTAIGGDVLGGILDPPFDMTGHSKVRFSCTYANPRDVSVGWGNGDQEMCIVFAYSDSNEVWSSGVLLPGNPGVAAINDGIVDFLAPECNVLTVDANH